MKILLRLFGYVRRYWLLGIIGLVCLACSTLLDMLIPQLIKRAIDQAIPSKNLPYLKMLVLGVGGIALAKFIMSFLQEITVARWVQKVIFDLRNDLYDSVQRLSFGYHDETQSGQLMSRVTSDVQGVSQFIGFGLLNTVYINVVFWVVLTILLRMNVPLTLLSLVVMPLIVYVMIRFAKKVRPLHLKVREQDGAMADAIQENILGVKVVKAFGREQYETQKFSSITFELMARQLKAVKIWAFNFPLLFFLIGTGTVAIMIMGGYQVIHGSMTIGELVAFNTYFFMIVLPMRMVGRIINLAQRANAAGQRIFEVIDEEREIRDKKEAITLKNIEGKIEFRNVSFGYNNVLPVLKNINLVIQPGETVALVGPTGSGKSTVASLIPRFYDATSGVVLIDEHNVQDIQLNSLRKQVGLVFQETFLYSASVAQNIAYGRHNATRQEIEACARLAQIHDFIVTLPQGYHTLIGERGVDLSGGQKQRLAIARTLLMNPRVLILDDSTSSVDVETEYQLREALKSVMAGRTNIIIAHRFSSIAYASRIIVLNNGSLVEEGTHRELMEKGTLYPNIYRLQFPDKDA